MSIVREARRILTGMVPPAVRRRVRRRRNETARRAYENGDWARAAAFWQPTFDRDPERLSPKGYYALASARRQSGEYPSAAEVLIWGLRLSPGHPKLLRELRALHEHDLDPATREVLLRARIAHEHMFDLLVAESDIDCDLLWAHITTVTAFAEWEATARLVRCFLEHCSFEQSGTDQVDIYRLCAKTLRQTGDFDTARELLDTALARHPEHPVLLTESLRLASAAHDHVNAVDVWKRLHRELVGALGPGEAASLADALVHADRVADAARLCDTMLLEHEGHPLLLRARANVLARAVWDLYNMTQVERVPGWQDRLLPVVDMPGLCSAIDEGLATFDLETRGAQGYRRRVVKSLCVALFGLENMPESERAMVVDTLIDVVFATSPNRSNPLKDATRRLCVEQAVSEDSVSLFVDALEGLDSSSGIRGRDVELLYRPLAWLGRFSLAHRLRVTGARLLVSEPGDPVSGSHCSLEAAIASIEHSDPATAARYLEDLAVAGGASPVTIAALEALLALLAGDRTPLQELWNQTLTPQETRLAEYLRGKSVAIVGPAPGELLNGLEIDHFDVIVRPNGYRAVAGDAVARSGSRTEICSLSASRSRRFRYEAESRGDRGINLAPGIEVALHKKRYVAVEGPDLKLEITRNSPKDLDRLTQGHSTHLPHLIYYLLGFSPARIKLFNSNLFLSETTHESAYRVLDAADPGPLSYSDMIDVGHWFLRAMWVNGNIEADAEVAGVLSLDTMEYMASIERTRMLRA